MISKEELSKIKEIRRTTLYYAEKEYLQYIFLQEIAKYADKFVFKGGTCLRIAYELERASEDLDFGTKQSIPEIKKIVRTCLKNFEYYNIRHEIYSEKEYQGNYRIEARFFGPLYNNDVRTTNTIKLDFNKKEPKTKKPVVIKKLFSDIHPFVLEVMGREEILAEKIRALIMRKQARDLYDVWMLISLGEKINTKLVKEKLAEEKIKKIILTLPSKKEYETDLKLLLRNVPDYDGISKKVKQTIENAQIK